MRRSLHGELLDSYSSPLIDQLELGRGLAERWPGRGHADGGRGGQGPHSNAGGGTGDDVTRYKFDYYVVTPGAGGEHYNISGWYCGGGGGGVMVNGHGPEAGKHQGQGYGGGGYRHSRGGSDMNHGNPGVIIMEISP